MDIGESAAAAAVRETLEQTGVRMILTGSVGATQIPAASGLRRR